MNFYDNYLRLCAEHGETPSGAAAAIGLSNAAASGWKKGKMPSDVTLTKLAEHFQCAKSELTWDRTVFSSNLMRIMSENGKGIDSFSRAIHVSSDQVKAWLSGASVPNRGNLIAISDVFGYDVLSLDKALVDSKKAAMPKQGGLTLDDIKQWIHTAGREELLELISAAADKMKEL